MSKKEKYNRIIVSRTDKIGDLILSIPSFYMVKKMYPEAELIVLVRKYNAEIVKNLSYIDRVIVIDEYRQKEIIDKIGYFKAEVFIALYVDELVMKLAKASKAKIKIGPLSKLKSFFVFNKGVRQKRSDSIKNEADYNLELVRKLNPVRYDEVFEINTDIKLGKWNIEAANRFFNEKKIGDKVLVVNPFMGGSAKNITDIQYADILRKVKQNVKNLDIVITTHIDEEERGIELLKKIGEERVYLYANGGDLLNIAAIIDRATVYFGGSTGPTHIAGALKKDIVAIYPNKATQSPTRWGVYGCDAEYIIPDASGETEEDYEHKNFDSYNLEIEQEIVKKLIERLE